MFRIASLIGQILGLIAFIVLLLDALESWRVGTLILQNMGALWSKVSAQSLLQARSYMAHSQWQSQFGQFLGFPAIVDLFGLSFIFSAIGRIGEK